MPKKLTREEFITKARLVHGDEYDYSKVEYVNSHTVIDIICQKHGEFWQAPNSHLRGCGCPTCYGTEKYTNETFIARAKEIHGDKYDYSDVEYVNNSTPVTIKCNTCGHVFKQIPRNHLQGDDCPKCAKRAMAEKQTYTFDEILERAHKIHGDKYDYSKFEYKGITEDGIIICKQCGHEFSQSMNSHLNQKGGCPFCAREQLFNSRKLNTESFIKRAIEVHGNKYDYSKVDYKDYETHVEIICPNHGSFWQSPDSHLQGKGCPKCAVHLSKGEDEICEYLRNLDVNVIQRYRELTSPYEIDIFLPEYNIGVEYNGLLWHSQKYKKDKNYHLNKMKLCNEKNVRLIQIFEDEYINKKDIVLSKLAHILGKQNDIPSIMARKCVIKTVNYDESKVFLEKNHIQGSVSATVYLGCYYNDLLVGVMTFKRENNDSNKWELTRFATTNDYVCCGVGGKLFSYFVKNYTPHEVKSFADRRWTINEDNNLYIQLGFVFDSYTNPDYHYYKVNGAMKREHKFNFRKEALHRKYGLPLTMTETEMIEELGYHKIYDCGLIKYVWKREK